jgi:hypothetical protein
MARQRVVLAAVCVLLVGLAGCGALDAGGNASVSISLPE